MSAFDEGAGVKIALEELSARHLGRQVSILPGPHRDQFPSSSRLGVITSVQHDLCETHLTVDVDPRSTGVRFSCSRGLEVQYFDVES